MLSLEILKELPLGEIKNLSKFYKNYQETLSHICSFFTNTVRWMENCPDKKYIQVFAPYGEWRPHGTFIALCQLGCKDVILHTLDKSKKKLLEALTNTNQIDWHDKTVLFYALDLNYIDAIDETMQILGLAKKYRVDTDIWHISQKEAALKNCDCPDEYELGKLEPNHATLLNDLWPHKGLASEDFIKILITMNSGYGIFTKAEGKLVAWIIKTHLGQPGLLHTMEEHKKRGLATVLINKICLDIAAEGDDVIATVLADNQASRQLFSKLGFTINNVLTFTGYEPRK